MAERKFNETSLRAIDVAVWNREVGMLHDQRSVGERLGNTTAGAENIGRLVDRLTTLQKDVVVLDYMRALLRALGSRDWDSDAIITLPSGNILDLRTALGQDTRTKYGTIPESPLDPMRGSLRMGDDMGGARR